MKKINKYNLEIILFIENAIYMILELIASRILSPYFGSSNLIWTSVIGIILLSTSLGNYIGGIIADKSQKGKLTQNISIILLVCGLLIFIIPTFQRNILTIITNLISSIKIGAILSTIILFFIPLVFIGMLSPIIIKLKMNELESVGKTSGRIYALATLGSIVGTFLGGFLLIPNYGSNEILFVLSIVVFALNFFIYGGMDRKYLRRISICIVFGIVINIICFGCYSKINTLNGKKVLNGELGTFVNYDTQYGKVTIYNLKYNDDIVRNLKIDKGNESATYVDEEKCYDLVYEYTKYYDLMLKSSREIKDTLMIGGAGYSYPKYYISRYLDKNMDVVEIDGNITEIAKEYFYLDKLINEYKINENNRLNLITQDGRVFLNQNSKKYDAILNDAFTSTTPVKTLTTKEAVQKIYNSLNENGIYLTNIISSIDGENSKFIKSEVKTLKQYFKNVYVVPCNDKDGNNVIQNNMVIATDEDISLEFEIKLICNDNEGLILTDNYCPVESIVPKNM